MAREWLETRQVMVANGLSVDQAQAVLNCAPGEWWVKVYHRCSEAPVAAFKDGQQLPDDWMCDQCERADIHDELTFERFKLLPDGKSRELIISSYINRKVQ
jgi:hypothetical protein